MGGSRRWIALGLTVGLGVALAGLAWFLVDTNTEPGTAGDAAVPAETSGEAAESLNEAVAGTPESTVEEEDEEEAAAHTTTGGALERIVADLGEAGILLEGVDKLSDEERQALTEDLSIEQQFSLAYVFSVSLISLPLSLSGGEECSDPDAFVDELAPGTFNELNVPVPELDGASVAEALNLTIEEVHADLRLFVSDACDDLQDAERS